jgi:hypothetical protein
MTPQRRRRLAGKPPWPVSNTGPMYMWNPAATTAPLDLSGSDEENRA